MKRPATLAVLFLLALTLLASPSARAQSTQQQAAPKSAGTAASGASPQAILKRYVAALRTNPDDDALRERIIRLALKIKPAPIVPTEAKEHLARGSAALQGGGLAEATSEFAQATNFAPWWGEGYWNLSAALDKAGMSDVEMKNLKFYLLTQPSPEEAEKANALIRDIESRPQQLKQSVYDLQKNPGDKALREKIISLARSIRPVPEPPQEAEECAREAEEAVKEAKTEADYANAAKEYRDALLMAPWMAAYYFNLAVVQAQNGKYEEAKSNFEFYLLAAPDAQDAADVRKRIAGLEAQASLSQYVAELQQNPSDDALREKIIGLAVTINPPPAIPENAQRFLGRGNAALQDAKTAQDFQDSVAEFQKATLAAPWFADAYNNMALAQSAAGDYDAAVKSLKLYLMAAPNSPDAAKAKTLMYELEYKQEKAEKERAQKAIAVAEEQRKAEEKQAILAGLSGYWVCMQGCSTGNVSVFSGRFQATVDTGPAEGGMAYDGSGRLVSNIVVTFAGTMNGYNLDGTMTAPRLYQPSTQCTIPSDSHAFTGTVSEDGNTITIHTENGVFTTHAQKGGSLLFPTITCTDISRDHNEPRLMILSKSAAPQAAPASAARQRGLFKPRK